MGFDIKKIAKNDYNQHASFTFTTSQITKFQENSELSQLNKPSKHPQDSRLVQIVILTFNKI